MTRDDDDDDDDKKELAERSSTIQQYNIPTATTIGVGVVVCGWDAAMAVVRIMP